MALFFYMFSFLMIAAAIMVIASRNPVHSVLWLIFTFANAAGLFVLIGAEFIAMIIVIIYVGAVAVLFLFVVMMLNIKVSEFKERLQPDINFAVIMALFLFADLGLILFLGLKREILLSQFAIPINDTITNTHAIGNVLYTDFILPFQICGIILFVAMIASIALVLRLRPGIKRQILSNQLARNKENSVELAKIKSNSGLNNLNYDD